MFTFFQAVVTGSPLGRIYATTNKPYYVAGELVQGNIVCEAKAPISANGIDLKVTGYEKTEWHDLKHRTETISPYVPAQNGQPAQAAQTKSIPVMHRHRGKKTFFNQTMRIYQIGGGMLAPGTYTFPFQYQLPEGIPGSFHERNPMPNIPAGCEWVDNDSYGESFVDSDDEEDGSAPQVRGRSGLLAVVHYKLKVTLDVNGFWMKDLFAKVPLVIHPKLEVGLQPAMQSLTKEVVVCCCFGKGNCTVTARFDKLAYVAGETADVKCDIQNDSTSDLKTRVILRRYLMLKSNNGSKSVVEDLVQQQYDTVPENTKSMDRKMPLQLVGPKIKPSTTGSFVSCNYEYLVECGVSMGDDIHLKMPVTVYAPQPPPIDAPQSPPPPAVVVAMQQPVMMPSPPPPQQQAQQPQVMVGVASPTVMVNSPQMQMNVQMGSPSYGQQQQMQPQYGSQPQQQQQYQQQPQQQYQQQQQYGSQPQQQQMQPQQYGSQPGQMQVQMQFGGPMQPQPHAQPNGMQMQMTTTSSSSSTHTVNGQVVSHEQQYQQQQY